MNDPGMNDLVKVLIVDDLEENLLALEALLRRPDVAVLKARSGRAALELLLVHEFALAILDVHMTEMDGFELAELMRGSERTRAVPIIFVTAGSHDQHRRFRGYESGAVDFLYKPLEPHALRRKAEIFIQLYLQRRELARRLDESQAAAAERERLLAERTEALRLAETLTAILGHDLRTPLTAIISTAEVLSRTLAPEQSRHAVRIGSSARRMSRMIDDLLDLARTRRAGGIPVEPGPVDLSKIAQRVALEQDPGKRRIHVEERGFIEGRWDEDRIHQALANLTANALRHGRDDAPVRLRLDGTRGDEVRIEVHNMGAIAPEAAEVIFTPFAATQQAATRRDGLGLGLYITRRIVEAHGGRIAFTSSEAEGTTFRIHLPRADLADPPPRPCEGDGQDHAGGEHDAGGQLRPATRPDRRLASLREMGGTAA